MAEVLKMQLLTVDELATELKVPRSWVYSRSRETGTTAIPRIKVGKYLRFNLDAVISWLKEQQNEAE
jgi:hypothetical protein